VPRTRCFVVLIIVVLAGALVGGVPDAAEAVGRSVLYVPPVEAAIVDHFRPPPCRWCAGNRGIDYDTAPGTAVRASAPGVVTFAGRVGGDGFVVVGHADGLRTTYGYLDAITVPAGAYVGRGTVVGTTVGRLHFGVRRGATYLDPELLLAGWRMGARLVPTDGAPPRRGRWVAV
jgi:murein DD-endopeptidase MepM/ murein hydrolase activator NlpD